MVLRKAGGWGSLLGNPILGFVVGGIVDKLCQNGENIYTTGKGFEGLFNMYIGGGKMGRIADCILAGLIAGQSLTLILVYSKRLFYCILLGIFYPFVVGMDTLNKVIGKKSNLVEKWFSQFAMTVFIQSIHGIILYIIYQFITKLAMSCSGVTEENGQKIIDTYTEDADKNVNAKTTAYLISFTYMVAITSLSKVEATVKRYLGVEAPMGSTKQNAKQMMAGYAMGKNAYSRIKDNFSGVRQGAHKVRDLKKEYNQTKKKEMDAANKEKNNKPDTNNSGSTNSQEMQQERNIERQVTNMVNNSTSNGANGANGAQVINSDGTPATGTGLATTGNGTPAGREAGRDLGMDILSSIGYMNPAINAMDARINEINSLMEAKNKNLGTIAKNANTVANDVDSLAGASNEKGGKKQRSSDEIKKELGQARRQLLGKTAAAAASPSIVLAGASIGVGAGDEKIGAAVISIADSITEAAGRVAAQTGAAKLPTDVMANMYDRAEYIRSTTISERAEDRRNQRSSGE